MVWFWMTLVPGSDLNRSFHSLYLIRCLEDKVLYSTLCMLFRSFQIQCQALNLKEIFKRSFFFQSLYLAVTCRNFESPSPFLSKVKWIEEFLCEVCQSSFADRFGEKHSPGIVNIARPGVLQKGTEVSPYAPSSSPCSQTCRARYHHKSLGTH